MVVKSKPTKATKKTSGGLRLHINSAGNYLGVTCPRGRRFYANRGRVVLGGYATAVEAAEKYARTVEEEAAAATAAKARESELEDHGQVLSQEECAKICCWAEKAIANNGEDRVRGQGDLFDMPISPRTLSRAIGKSTLTALIGTHASRQHQCEAPSDPSTSSSRPDRSDTGLEKASRLAKASPSSGLGFRSRALDRLRHARGSVIKIGAPVMNVVVMRKGEEFAQHFDRCAVTINVPLTAHGTFKGGRFYYISKQDKQVNPTMVAGHAYSHEGALEHGVSKVTSGSRYTLAIHYLPGDCSARDSRALSKVTTPSYPSTSERNAALADAARKLVREQRRPLTLAECEAPQRHPALTQLVIREYVAVAQSRLGKRGNGKEGSPDAIRFRLGKRMRDGLLPSPLVYDGRQLDPRLSAEERHERRMQKQRERRTRDRE